MRIHVLRPHDTHSHATNTRATHYYHNAHTRPYTPEFNTYTLSHFRAGIYPFFIASHTSAWAQPNDCGLNALYKSKYFVAVKAWRRANPFSVYDRIAFNECAAEAIQACEVKLATDLATSKAKMAAWVQAGSPPKLKPRCKRGNAVTRMYEKTGWWPLKCNSVLWNQAIDTLGAICKPSDHRVGQKLEPLADFGNDKSLKIRQLVLTGFNEHFLQKAHRAEEAAKKRSRRRSRSRSTKNSALGKGLTKEQVTSDVTPSLTLILNLTQTLAGPCHH